MRRINRILMLALALLVTGAGSALAGSAFISGDDSDDNTGDPHCRAPNCGNMMGKILNLLYLTDCGFGLTGDGILAIGTNAIRTRSALDGWNNPANFGPGTTITHCNTIACIDGIGYNDGTPINLADYRILYVASVDSETTGGLLPDQLAALNDGLQPDAINRWFNNIGGTDDGRILALTEADVIGGYSWLPIALETEDSKGTLDDVNVVEPNFTNVFPGHGATDFNLDHCCYHNVFTGPAGFNGMLILADTPDQRVDDPENPGTLIDGPIFLGNTCFDLNAGPVCDPGGPYEAVCDGSGFTSVPVDGSGSRDPEGGPLTYSWTTDCAGGSFDDPTIPKPLLTMSFTPPCPVECTVVLTVTDDDAQSSSCTAAVRADDTIAPFLDVAAPLVMECAGPAGFPDSDPEIATWLAEATASDLCTAVNLVDDHPAVFAAGCSVETLVEWIATDECGNVTKLASTVTVVDTTPPSLTVPAPLVLECNGPGPVPATDPRIAPWLAAATASDGCGGVTLADDHPAEFGSGCSVTTVVEWVAVDACGQATSLTSSVTFIDTTPPAISIPAPLFLECNSAGGVAGDDPRVLAWLALASASDRCGAVASFTHDAPAFLASGCVPGQETIVHWTATDACGNAAAAQGSIVVVDLTPPVVRGVLLPLDPLPPISSTSPGSPASPASPGSALSGCSASAKRLFLVDCGVEDICDPNPILTAEILVTTQEVPAAGVCTSRVEVVAVSCGETIEIELLAPLCPKKPQTSSSGAVSVNSDGTRTVRGQAVVLRVTGVDNCSNETSTTFDPSAEPSPTCELQLPDGTCCPPIGAPEGPKCDVPLCDLPTPLRRLLGR